MKPEKSPNEREFAIARVLRPLGDKPLSVAQAKVAAQLLGVHWIVFTGAASVPPSVVPVSVPVPVSVVPVSALPVSGAVLSMPDASGTAATSSPPHARARTAEEQVTRPSAIQRRLGMVAE